MSEFSGSYHLVADDQESGAALLRRAGVDGWVFPATNGWVTIVPNEAFGSAADPAIVEANTGLLLFYSNAEDHGWRLSLARGSSPVSDYLCLWEDEIKVDDDALALDELIEALATVCDPVPSSDELRALLYPASYDDIGPPGYANPGHRFAAMVGIEYYEWLSGHYLRLGTERGDDLPELEVASFVEVTGSGPPVPPEPASEVVQGITTVIEQYAARWEQTTGVYIAHAWGRARELAVDSEYNQLSNLITEAKPGAVVWSLPFTDPSGGNRETDVAGQMDRANIMFVTTAVYEAHPEPVEQQMATARRFDVPIVAVTSRDAEGPSAQLHQQVSATVGWDRQQIADMISQATDQSD